MWEGQISAEQIEALEELFATLTPTGWTIPDWLVWLKSQALGVDT